MTIHCKSHDGPLRIILKCSDVILDLIMTDWSILPVTFPPNNITVQYNRKYIRSGASLGGNNPKSVNAAADGAVCGDHVVCDEHRIDFNWSSWRFGQSWLAPAVSLDVCQQTSHRWLHAWWQKTEVYLGWMALFNVSARRRGASRKHRPVRMGD